MSRAVPAKRGNFTYVKLNFLSEPEAIFVAMKTLRLKMAEAGRVDDFQVEVETVMLSLILGQDIEICALNGFVYTCKEYGIRVLVKNTRNQEGRELDPEDTGGDRERPKAGEAYGDSSFTGRLAAGRSFVLHRVFENNENAVREFVKRCGVDPAVMVPLDEARVVVATRGVVRHAAKALTTRMDCHRAELDQKDRRIAELEKTVANHEKSIKLLFECLSDVQVQVEALKKASRPTQSKMIEEIRRRAPSPDQVDPWPRLNGTGH